MMSNILHWLLPIIGIGFVIFVHELGHFLAARSMGVRVEAFSIGFGPRLFGFRRGSTDWKICLIPLGGFVKMAGETPGSEKTGADDEFSSKSVAARSLIISAGVIMNVIFALVALPIAFMMGVPFEAPIIGSVDVGHPAWRAGIRAEDRIRTVDGRRTLGFEDVVTAIAIGGDVVTIEGERDGKPFTTQLPTERDERRGLPTIGISPSYVPIEIKAADVDPALADDDSKAAAEHRRKAGLKAGDVIETIDDSATSEVPDDISDPRELILGVRRDGASIQITLPPLLSTDEDKSLELFGVATSNLSVKEVVPGTQAAALGLVRDDRIVAVNGQDVMTTNELRRALARTSTDGAISVDRAGRIEELKARLSDPAVRRSLRVDVEYQSTGRRVVPIDGSPAALAGIRRGDEIVSVNGQPVTRFEEISKVSLDKKVTFATFVVRRGSAETSPDVTVTLTRARIPSNQALAGLEHKFLRETVRRGFVDSLGAGFDYTVMMTARVFMTLKSLFSRRVSAENLGGIITIFRQSKESTKIAFSRGLLFLAVISINLAVLNVIPIPVLDGGWLLLLLIERLRGKPVSERVLGVVSWIGFVLVLGLMVFATWNDIRRL